MDQGTRAGRKPMPRGSAIAWRAPIATDLARLAAAGRLQFTEVVAENIDPAHAPQPLLDLARQVTVIPHGVSLGLADASTPDPARLQRLSQLAELFDAPLVSEHLAFVRAAETPDALHGDVLEAGHLMPPPRTQQMLEVVVENIEIAQSQLPVPLAIENIAALLRWPEDEFDEPEFLSEIVRRTGVRIVLDVANLHSSATARGTDAYDELLRFPLDAVAYVHVAGGTERDGLYIDTHGHAVPKSVADLLTSYVAHCTAVGAPLPGIMLERDTDIHSEAVLRDLDTIDHAVTQGLSRVNT
ncbi:MbnB/TglH/ChrH family RiPP precursor modification enzyme [Calidifontibacter terrae]